MVIRSKDYSKFSTPDLLEKFQQAVDATAASLYEAAEIWSELSRRGEAPARLYGVLQWLPRIARGDLAAETVCAFASQSALLGSLSGMPLDEQRKYAAGKPVEVATFDQDNKPVMETKPLSSLSAREVKLAVDKGQVRSVKAQINSLRRSKSQTKTQYTKVTIVADRSAGLIVIGHARVAPQELARALAQLGWRLEKIQRRVNSQYEQTRPQA